ncbi:glycoside hydrolase family 108 protein [Roseomonas sp. BN140053]|uniref:glycoside hydrolase family 108 protein n=1 Tax=Roseomonas sp. BN140053 TaxID=3391898 RepID=UPI0039EB2615
MSDPFLAYIEPVLGKEGGFSDHPSDRGGATMWGITEAVARAFGYQGPMRGMPRNTAIDIYRARYWTQPSFDRIAEIDAPLGAALLDIGINMGQAAAGKMLQRLLNVLNGRGVFYGNLTVDGACGAMTRAALNSLIQKRGPRARVVLLRGVRALQAGRYVEICEANPTQEDFAWGWLSGRAFADD